MNRTATYRLLLNAILLLASSGCHTVQPGELSARPLTFAPAGRPDALIDPATTNVISIRAAILYALHTDAEIGALAARAHRAAGDLAGVLPASPEIRFGYENARDTRTGWSWDTETGSGTGSERRFTKRTGEQSTERWQTTLTDFGDVFDPDQTSVEHSSTREAMMSTEEDRRRSSSSWTEQTAGTEWHEQDAEGLSVELRLRPPNPWQFLAERQAARSALALVETELLAREQELICDILEAGLELAHRRRMLAIRVAFAAHADSVKQKLRDAFAVGSLPPDDYADACQLSASAHAGVLRLEARTAELHRDLRRLTGLDPARLDCEAIAHIAVFPFAGLPDPDRSGDWAASLTAAHASVLRAKWLLHQLESERNQARSAGIPWIAHVAAGYAWRDGTRSGYGRASRVSSTRRSSSASGNENEVETSTTEARESETPSGDVETRTETGIQSGTTQTRSSGSESETESSMRNEQVRARDDGEEWWVEIGIDVPIFEWMSGHAQTRQTAVHAARQAVDQVERRVHYDILAALQLAQREDEALQRARSWLERELPELKRLAAVQSRLGLAGEVKALRTVEDGIEQELLMLDCDMRAALARVELTRVAGLTPILDGEP